MRIINPKQISRVAVYGLAVPGLCLLLAACASTPPPSPNLSAGARRAIELAQSAGAEEHAPLELRFAREKLSSAQQATAAEEYERAGYLLEQAEVDAELALARTRAEVTRLAVEALREEVRNLRQNIADNFGLEALE